MGKPNLDHCLVTRQHGECVGTGDEKILRRTASVSVVTRRRRATLCNSRREKVLERRHPLLRNRH